MGSISSSRRDQVGIHDGAGGPSVALVDDVAVGVQLQGAIEVGADVDRALAVVGCFAAPENDLSIVISSFELQPDVKRVHGAPREEVAQLPRTYHDLDPSRIPTPHS